MKIIVLDLDFQGNPRAIAAYLVVGDAGPVLVETGPGSTLPVLHARLAENGYGPQDIGHVLVTHVHLDHAGSAGWWASQGAEVFVHHIGAPHLIDPTRLLLSAGRIYGDAMDHLWGQVIPAPAERVRPLSGGDVIDICSLRFHALDTPGHARHHLVYRLQDVAFTGDIAGVRLPDATTISLPAPPPEFDLATWQSSLNLLRECSCSVLYPTHFGAIHDPSAHLDGLSELLAASAEFVRERMAAGMDRDTLLAHYASWQRERAHAVGMSDRAFQAQEIVNPTTMSIDGMMRYWSKRPN